MKKAKVDNFCLECGETAQRYMLADEKKHGVKWGWHCNKCFPHSNLGKEWLWAVQKKDV